MSLSNTRILNDILRREGSEFTDRPSDRGGPTKFGITQSSWDDYRLTRPALPVSVRDIDRMDAERFYLNEYIKPLEWLEAERLHALMVDCAVNHGKHRAVSWLQEIVGVKVDGIDGERTIRATKLWSPRELYAALLRRRFNFYAEIASDQLPADPDLPNLRGWISRATEFIE